MLFDNVMLRNMYGHNEFVIEEEFNPFNWEPVCMLAKSVSVGKTDDVAALLKKLDIAKSMPVDRTDDAVTLLKKLDISRLSGESGGGEHFQ
ncbi:hypothetical protein QYF36_005232 [Acer negundo]|nr:hypothetical protein QYF36_005232 [Acer negundo]